MRIPVQICEADICNLTWLDEGLNEQQCCGTKEEH